MIHLIISKEIAKDLCRGFYSPINNALEDILCLKRGREVTFYIYKQFSCCLGLEKDFWKTVSPVRLSATLIFGIASHSLKGQYFSSLLGRQDVIYNAAWSFWTSKININQSITEIGAQRPDTHTLLKKPSSLAPEKW